MKYLKLILFVSIMFFFVDNNYCQEKGIHNSAKLILNDSITLLVKISKFDTTINKIEKCKVLNWEGVCLINGGLVFGTDFEIPKTVLEKIEVNINDIKIELDVSCMYDPNGSSLALNRNQFDIQVTEGGFFLKGNFSDGAGSYSAIWKIVKNKSLRVFIGEPCSP